jgi:DNA-binding NarL/FixJ family response regulator
MTEAIKILLVEDSEIIQERLVHQFSPYKEFNIVGFAKTVVEANQKFDELKPHIVVLDMKLQIGYGLEVLIHIRSKCTDCLVIVLTNYSSPSIKKECLELGADFFLDKSFEFEQVIEKCREAIQTLPKFK